MVCRIYVVLKAACLAVSDMSISFIHSFRFFFFQFRCFSSLVQFFTMVKTSSFIALSALGMGVLAHPTIKHIDRRLCPLDERSVFARADLTSRTSIPEATTWDPPSSMVTALDQVG